MAKLIVTSSVDGKRRAGTVFTGATPFALDHFTGEQLAAIIADPVLTVVVGDIVTATNVGELLKKAAPKAAKTEV